jgi:polysaccharide pyruvyl transferase WcaK-like protein
VKINIFGWYGKQNIGDDAFKDVFMQKWQHHDLTFSLYPMLDADAIVVGGGSSNRVVCKKYIDSFMGYKKPLYAVGVDIAINGPIWEATQALPFRHLYVRSKEYVRLAAQENKISYTPDIVFSLYDKTRLRTTNKKKCGFILSVDLIGGVDHLGKVIRELKKEYDEVVFIVMYTELSNCNDIAITTRVIEESKCECRMVIPDTPTATMAEMADLDFIVSMRFHGIIFATMLGIPFIALANKGKCSLFCEQERLFGHYMELCEMNDVKLLDRITWLKDTNAKNDLLDIAHRNKIAVDQVFNEIEDEIF